MRSYLWSRKYNRLKIPRAVRPVPVRVRFRAILGSVFSRILNHLAAGRIPLNTVPPRDNSNFIENTVAQNSLCEALSALFKRSKGPAYPPQINALPQDLSNFIENIFVGLSALGLLACFNRSGGFYVQVFAFLYFFFSNQNLPHIAFC